MITDEDKKRLKDLEFYKSNTEFTQFLIPITFFTMGLLYLLKWVFMGINDFTPISAGMGIVSLPLLYWRWTERKKALKEVKRLKGELGI